MSHQMSQLKNLLSTKIFGMSLAEALDLEVCLDCKGPVDASLLQPLDRKEYQTHGLCPTCYHAVTP